MTELEKQLTEIVANQTKQIGTLLSQNEALLAEIAGLKEQLGYLTKKLFGTSSEKTKVGTGQLSIFEEISTLPESKASEAEMNEVTVAKEPKRSKQKGHKGNLIKDLDVVENSPRIK